MSSTHFPPFGDGLLCQRMNGFWGPVMPESQFAKDRRSVLCVGSDLQLLGLRQQVLQNAGFKVFATSSENQAILHMQQDGCTALVLCHSLRESTQLKLIENYRKHCPDGKIIGISEFPWSSSENIDVAVYGGEGPEVLFKAIRGADKV